MPTISIPTGLPSSRTEPRKPRRPAIRTRIGFVSSFNWEHRNVGLPGGGGGRFRCDFPPSSQKKRNKAPERFSNMDG